MKLFIIFFNNNGNRKLAIDMNNTPISQLDNNMSRLINGICVRNGYTFSYHSLKDNDVLLKNIPILALDMFN